MVKTKKLQQSLIAGTVLATRIALNLEKPGDCLAALRWGALYMVVDVMC